MAITQVGTDQPFAFADGNAGHACNFGSGPSAGDWDVIRVASDTVVSTPSGFSLLATRVNNMGAYIFGRKAAGGESASVTITTSGDANTVVIWTRLAGADLNDTAGNVAVGADTSSGSATPTATTGTLAGTGEAVCALGALSNIGGGAQTSPSWSGSFTAGTTGISGLAGSGVRAYSATRIGAGTAAAATEVTWSGDAAQNRYTLLAAFTVAAGGGSNDGSGTAAGSATTATGTGTIDNSGSGTAASDATTATGAGTITNAGSGTAAADATTASGTGSTGYEGSGTAASDATTASGTGTISNDGSGTAASEATTATGTGTVPINGSGTAASGVTTAVGTGTGPVAGAGATAMSSRIALLWFTESLGIERYEGDTAYGPSFAGPEAVAGAIDQGTKEVLTATGDTVISTARCFLPVETSTVRLGSRVTLPDAHGGGSFLVIGAMLHRSGQRTPDHLELTLQ